MVIVSSAHSHREGMQLDILLLYSMFYLVQVLPHSALWTVETVTHQPGPDQEERRHKGGEDKSKAVNLICIYLSIRQ